MKKQILTAIIILLCLGRAIGQPQIFLGSSKQGVRNYMKSQPMWTLEREKRDQFTYSHINGQARITYNFVKNSPGGMFYTCTSCSITLPDAPATDKYIRERLTGLRFKASADSLRWTLVTDLCDFTIHVIRCGNTLIYKY